MVEGWAVLCSFCFMVEPVLFESWTLRKHQFPFGTSSFHIIKAFQSILGLLTHIT
ncbi:hypothetical protein I79_022014 [Cricetulus griseus]|uniref:Uncharacterized protein n=1 Tax=Cricetulus griseus TaxID=10029 RepID=G3IE70_CRIGR|nr:hypothetical protein I79_022014 [Cricetulus griseus]